jgi:hypothetical protein
VAFLGPWGETRVKSILSEVPEFSDYVINDHTNLDDAGDWADNCKPSRRHCGLAENLGECAFPTDPDLTDAELDPKKGRGVALSSGSANVAVTIILGLIVLVFRSSSTAQCC